jgi:hypothetical protein
VAATNARGTPTMADPNGGESSSTAGLRTSRSPLDPRRNVPGIRARGVGRGPWAIS